MLSLLRLAVWSLAMTAFVWFALTVPVGSRTLWRHARAIAGTHEAEVLAEGTREEALRAADWLRRQLTEPAAEATGPAPASAGRPMESLAPGDRDDLRRTIRAGSPSPERGPARR